MCLMSLKNVKTDIMKRVIIVCLMSLKNVKTDIMKRVIIVCLMKPEECEDGYHEEGDYCVPDEPVGVKDIPPPSFNLIVTTNQSEKINTDVGGQVIPFQFLVLLKSEVSDGPGYSQSTLDVLTDEVELRGAEVLYKYENAINGFAFKAPNQQILDKVLGFLQADPNVSVEQDKITVPFTEELPTGIQRVDAACTLYCNNI